MGATLRRGNLTGAAAARVARQSRRPGVRGRRSGGLAGTPAGALARIERAGPGYAESRRA